MFVCLHFLLEFLKQNKRVHSCRILREIVVHGVVLDFFSAPKIFNAIYIRLQSRHVFALPEFQPNDNNENALSIRTLFRASVLSFRGVSG